MRKRRTLSLPPVDLRLAAQVWLQIKDAPAAGPARGRRVRRRYLRRRRGISAAAARSDLAPVCWSVLLLFLGL